VKKNYKVLLNAAKIARRNAYAPYSGLKVGAAVLTKNGNIYTGANVENASFGITNCAERSAIFKAVSEGDKEIVAVAISNTGQAVSAPCGACRQVIYEFSENADVVMEKAVGGFKVEKIKKLLPLGFKLKLAK
jgi:cytidine deaminase